MRAGTDGGPGPCLGFSKDDADCVLECVAAFPDAKTKFMALERCVSCDTCFAACSTESYCTALEGDPDAGPDASLDAAPDATSDAASDATTDSPAEASSDAPVDAASD